MAATEERVLMSVDYEVYGKVQGCFFRKHLFAKCKELGLKGWVRNTRTGTVIGTIQGEPEPIAEMKNWLMYVGSPNSRIATCEFNNERRISVEEYPEFTILHN